MPMTKARDDFKVLFVQVPEVLWERLDQCASESSASLASVVTKILAKHFKVDPSTLPKPKRAGRKPKSH